MIYIEKAGKPTVSIASGGFEDDSEASARAFGMPEVPFVVVPDVVTSVPPERSVAQVSEQLEGIVRALTTPSVSPSGNGHLRAERLPGPPMIFQGEDAFDALDQFNKTFLDNGWGDGFPLIAPTPERVERMMRGTTRAADDVVGILPPGMGIATVQGIAITAVMAGCEPEHLPVLIAGAEAVIQMGGRARQWLMSTSSDAPFMLINGPIVDELGMNTGACTIGPGQQSRVNIVLGRGLRLMLMNQGHNYPTEMDMDTIGSPSKFSFCGAEPVNGGPWVPFHVTKGYLPKSSTISVAGVSATRDAADTNNFTPDGILGSISGSLGGGGYTSYRWSDPDPYDPAGGSGVLVVLCPDHANVCADAGWSKEMVQDFLWGHSKTSAAGIRGRAKVNPDFLLPSWRWLLNLSPEEAARTALPGFNRPDRIEIAVFGGAGGKSQVMGLNGPTSTIEIKDRVG